MRGTMLGAAALAIHALVETPFEAPAIPFTLIVLGWCALAESRREECAASFVLRWPPAAERLARFSVGASTVAVAGVLWAAGVAAPFASHLLANYAEGPEVPPARIDLAVRLSEACNPWQPFLGYRRARAALARVPRLPPVLLANAMESLEKTIRLEPGDPSAYALLARLYARAAADLPGAGPGAIDAAERRWSEAIRVAPLDARLRIERGGFRLSGGRGAAALRDATGALALEPNALAAHLLRVEALADSGWIEGAARALRGLDTVAARLRAYEPLNGYEASLLRVDGPALERIRERLGSLLLVVPAGRLLGRRHAEIRRGRPLGEDLFEEGLRPALLPAALAVPEGMGRHAGLADDRLHLVPGHRLDGVVQEQLAPRAVVFDDVAEARRPLAHELNPQKEPLVYRLPEAARRPSVAGGALREGRPERDGILAREARETRSSVSRSDHPMSPPHRRAGGSA